MFTLWDVRFESWVWVVCARCLVFAPNVGNSCCGGLRSTCIEGRVTGEKVRFGVVECRWCRGEGCALSLWWLSNY